ncbi:MAG: hypothetical protein JST54_06450 [Deltaproteobacteria bacterium]|nr:hypothetical protein [Deltaproteobacteria bacterium]
MRTRLLIAVLGIAATFGALALHGCGGCVHENRVNSVDVEPAQSCLSLSVDHDSGGVVSCGGFSVGGVNNCSQTLTLQLHGQADAGPSGADGGAVDGGASASGTSFPSDSSVSFQLLGVPSTTAADGTQTWTIPGTLGPQSIAVTVVIGPAK